MSKEQLSGIKIVDSKAGLHLSVVNDEVALPETNSVDIVDLHSIWFPKPLLDLNTFRPTDSLQDQWKIREQEIQDQIDIRRISLKKDILVGHEGEPLFKDKGRRRNHRKPQLYYTVEQYKTQRPLDNILLEEAEDEKLIIDTLLKPGDHVCKILGSYEPGALSRMANKVGMEGKVYYITSTPHLRERLFGNFFNLFASLRRVKDEEESQGLELFSGDLAAQMNNLLTAPFIDDLDFYQSGYQNLDRLMDSFYQRYPVVPLQHQVPPLPDLIDSGSIDIVLELDRMGTVNESKKEELLWEIDRILKPGGYLLMRENSQHQAEVEYYGQEIFAKYSRFNPSRRVKYAPRWILLKKIEPGTSHFQNITSLEETQPDQKICVTQHNWDLTKEEKTEEEFSKQLYLALKHMITQKHEINGEISENYVINDSLKEKLSLAWFKKVGLLRPFMTEFVGNIDVLVEFVMFHNHPNQLPRNNVMPPVLGDRFSIRNDKTVAPREVKPFYTVDDLAKELGAKKGAITKFLRKGGIKTSQVSNFNTRSVQAKELHFSYEEYVVLRDALKREDIKPNKLSEQKKGNDHE